MKKFRNTIFYVVTIGVFTALAYWIFLQGSDLEEGREIIQNTSSLSKWDQVKESMLHNLQHPLAILLAQIVTIILAARTLGWVFNKIGQPTVVGEILAGIILGPSLIGMYFPEFSANLFPPDSLGNLQFLSQIGLILFMFVIGMELDLSVLKKKANEAIVISHASIILPFASGMFLAYYIYESYAPTGVPFLSFGLFLGIAMSITAFPVLARIVQERGIHKTKLGTMVITCAAADDITAWCILAAVIAIVKAGSIVSALYIIVLSALYVLLMIKVIKPFLKRVGDLHQTQENLSKPIVAIFLVTLIVSSYATEIIGIHALFGAFMAGAIMPDNAKFRNIFIEKVEDISLVLLLPLFFVFTGLRTEIGLIDDPELWKLSVVVIAVAIGGKFLGSALAARFIGQNWKDSLTIGALMNTRGLMELVVLNIGYDLGVLSPEIFTIMVIMALVTTFMTGPALDFINWIFRKQNEPEETEIKSDNRFKILVSFGNPKRAKSLIKLAHLFIRKQPKQTVLTAMHLTPSNELNQFNIKQYEKDSFSPILKEAKILNQKVEPLFKATNDINSDILEIANKGDHDFLLVGAGQSIFEGTLLGKILGFTTRIINPEKLIGQVTGKENLFETSPFDERSRLILAKSHIPVGCFIDKEFDTADQVFIPLFSEDDLYLIRYAVMLIKNADSKITLLDVSGQLKSHHEIQEIKSTAKEGMFTIMEDKLITQELLGKQNLMLIAADSWKKLVDTKSAWLSDIPSTLIMSEPVEVKTGIFNVGA